MTHKGNQAEGLDPATRRRADGGRVRACRLRASYLQSPVAAHGYVTVQLLIDLAAKPLRNVRAFAARRDGDLQIAARDQRSKKEIAVGNVIHSVAESVSFDRAPVDSRVHLGIVGRSDNQEIAVQIGSFKAALHPFELVFECQIGNLDACLGCKDPQL